MNSPGLQSSLAILIAVTIIILPAAQGQDSQVLRVVPAQEILDKISRGEPVVYRDVIIQGDLNISDLDLPTVPSNRSDIDINYLGLANKLKVVRSFIDLGNSVLLLSGGKLVFDPPEYRVAPGRSRREIKISKALFIVERLLGMVLVIMFAIAVGKTIIMGGG